MFDAILPLLESMMGPHIDWKQVFLIGMTPLFLLSFAIEWRVMLRRGQREHFVLKDILANLGLGGSYQVFEILAHSLVTGAAVLWLWEHRLFEIPVNAYTIVPIFLGVEFCYYWFHRASHRIRWFWSAHVVHHSSEHMNMTTAMRQSLLYSITGWWLFFCPLILLGVHPAVVFFLYACNLAYQFFIHTESVGKLHPLIEFIFDTPSHHRVHHGRNPQYIDKNYGGVLILFDRLFGTFEPEVDKVEYGIPKQIHSYNILTLNLHEFAAMWSDVARPGSLIQRLRHLWMPPEYQRPAQAPDAPPQAQLAQPARQG